MALSRSRFPLPMTVLAAACLVALSPLTAIAGDDPQRPVQPPAGGSAVVVEQVENGPAFGVEFKYTEINREDAFLLGGYAGAIFDNRLFIGGAGYWQVDTSYYGHDDYYYGYDDYYGHDGYYDDGYYDDGHYGGLNGYGGLLLEWYALRSPAVALSMRGLIGGGIARVGWSDYVGIPNRPPATGRVAGTTATTRTTRGISSSSPR